MNGRIAKRLRKKARKEATWLKGIVKKGGQYIWPGGSFHRILKGLKKAYYNA